MTFNVELGKRVYDFIVANPERHYQKDWTESSGEACGTTACVAGWTCIMGLDIPLKQHVYKRWNYSTDSYDEEPGNFYWSEPVNGWERNASELLNIEPATAEELFRNTTDKEAKEALGLLIAGESEEEVIRFIRSGEGMETEINGCHCGCEDEDDNYYNDEPGYGAY